MLQSPAPIPSDELSRVLVTASQLDRADIIAKVIEDGGNSLLRYTDAEGLTPLHHATKRGSKDAVRVLLRLGADVRAADASGATAVQLADADAAMAQIFLTEAIQSIARGDGARLEALLDAGMRPDALYGSDGDGGGNSSGGDGGASADGSGSGGDIMSLLGWAHALGQDDLAALLARRGGGEYPGAAGKGGGESSSGAGAGSLDDRIMDLRARIDGLAGERVRLERLLEGRGAQRVVIVLRQARLRLEACIAEAEAAAAGVAAAEAQQRRVEDENAALQRDIVQRAAELQAVVMGGRPPQPVPLRPRRPPHTAAAAASSISNAAAGGPAAAAGSNAEQRSESGRTEISGTGAENSVVEVEVAVEAGDLRQLEERNALGDQLERMAADLSQEVSSMALVATGEGGGDFAAALSAMRERGAQAQEDAARHEGVARYLAAQAAVLTQRGEELRRQLKRLDELLAGAKASAAERETAATAAAAGAGRAATDVLSESSLSGGSNGGGGSGGGSGGGGAARQRALRPPRLSEDSSASASVAAAAAAAVAPRILSAYDEEQLREVFEAERAASGRSFLLTVLFAVFGWGGSGAGGSAKGRGLAERNSLPILMA